MIGRIPDEAAHLYRDSLQQALSCVARNVLVASRGGRSADASVHDLSLGRIPASLPGSSRLALTTKCRYLVATDLDTRTTWRVHPIAYSHTLLDSEGRELLAYHWHPEGASHEKEPHLHLGSGAAIGRRELVKAHLPTGQVTLQDVLRLAIHGLGIRPLRRGWAEVLESSKRAMMP